MDPGLHVAAEKGDVEFLRKAVVEKSSDYFLTQDYDGQNIFHLAAGNNRVEFVRTAREILPTEVVLELLSQKNRWTANPLHTASWYSSSAEILKLMVGFYKSYSGPPIAHHKKSWLALDNYNKTPLHCVFYKKNEETAMEVLSMPDIELIYNIEDNNRCSPLFHAVKRGYIRVAEKILMSPCSHSLNGENGSTALHFAHNTSENILRLLLEKHLELIGKVEDNGHTILHTWAEKGKVWVLDLLLNEDFPAATTKVFKELLFSTTDKKKGDSPLHTATRMGNIDFIQALINGYKQVINESIDTPPWKIKNRLDGDTPLHIALVYKQNELASYFLKLDSTLCSILNNKGESSLFVAVKSGCDKQVEEMLTTHEVITFRTLCSDDGTTVLHLLQHMPGDDVLILHEQIKENVSRMLLEKFWWIINLKDSLGRTALDEARRNNILWLIDMLENPFKIKKEPIDWREACERGDIPALLAIIDNSIDANLQKNCDGQNDTPLHHIKLQTYEEYLNLLRKPSIADFKNRTNFEGATPLHRALQRKDIPFAKALLVDKDVDLNIKDCHGNSAVSLLADLCKRNKDWDILCNQLKIYPLLRTKYVVQRTNLDQMRNTLSVVATLLATITFAAGFTVPGGLDDKSGNAILAKRAAFLVFILADAYAFCMSILVLFSLIWSMISDHDISLLLVDSSVIILMQSLYGTMVAFMTGIYTIIAHDSIWAAIVILVMCCFIGILVNKTILHKVLSKLVRTAYKDRKDKAQSSEKGKNIEETSSNPLHKLKSFLKKKMCISSRDQNQKDGPIPLSVKEKESTSKNDDSQETEGTSNKLVQYSNSFKRKKHAIPAEIQDDEDQIRCLEEGQAFTYGNDDARAMDSTVSNPFQRSKYF